MPTWSGVFHKEGVSSTHKDEVCFRRVLLIFSRHCFNSSCEAALFFSLVQHSFHFLRALSIVRNMVGRGRSFTFLIVMSLSQRQASEITERLFSKSPCLFYYTVDGVLSEILSHQRLRWDPTLGMKVHYCLPWWSIPTSSLRVAPIVRTRKLILTCIK